MKNIKFTILALALTFATFQVAGAQLVYVPTNTVSNTSVWAPTSTTNTTTNANGCVSGALYSSTTGQPCNSTPAPSSNGCITGGLFSITTGQPCNGSTGGGTSVSGCLTLSGDLSIGMSDSWSTDITKLQALLISKGYLSAGNSTGYFGSLTFAAVKSFQAENGVNSTGYVGPLTRARILTLTCGEAQTPPWRPGPPIQVAPLLTSLSPSYGPFGTTITIYGTGFNPTNNTINFANISGVATNIPSYNGTSIQYTVSATACSTNDYRCSLIGLGNGSYPLSVTTPYATSNSLTFTATNSGTTNPPTTNPNGPPVVNGIDGPSILATGQMGTWTIRATDQTGGGLSYQVTWGDEAQYGGYVNNTAYTQSATLTHTYFQTGIYRPSVTIRGSNGLTVQASLTVTVTSNGAATGTAPTIGTLSPSSGPVGTVVTVTGSNFTATDNTINFANVNRAITGIQSSNNGTNLVFNVPATPCTQGTYCSQIVISPGTYPVSVSTTYGTSSSLNFQITSGNVATSTDQSITKALNVVGTVVDLQVTALKIVEDSRCPTNVTCIQAGRVVVQTRLKTSLGTATINLTTAGEEFILDGYHVKITGVTPSKTSTSTIASGQYRITYRVTK